MNVVAVRLQLPALGEISEERHDDCGSSVDRVSVSPVKKKYCEQATRFVGGSEGTINV